MEVTTKPDPTLWRTCRAIANSNRLNIFAFLIKHPDQTVTAVGARFELPLPTASEYLRLLESRGLLKVQRTGKWVKYRVASPDQNSPGSLVAAAMRTEFQRDDKAAEKIFKLATAFTHPRRIEVFRLLQAGPKSVEQLRNACKASLRALDRHLKKLETRGFVCLQDDGTYAVTESSRGLRHELASRV